MKSKLAMGLMIVMCFAGAGLAAPMSQIWYSSEEFGAGQWQYTYEVTNIGLTSPIEQFTVWFEYGLYENLMVETTSPLADNWDEIPLQPEPVLEDDGAYDAKALGVPIDIGQTIGGFAVSFDWLGLAEPGPQLYEIIDPATSETTDSGTTIPEPATLLLLGLGALTLRRKQ